MLEIIKKTYNGSMKIITIVFIFLSMCLASCLKSSSDSSRVRKKVGDDQDNLRTIPTPTPTPDIIENLLPQVELTHFVDPLDGTYKSKITIPKNYAGLFYIHALNASSLTDKIIYVRLKFGVELEDVVMQAAIVRGKGIIPTTDVLTIQLDLYAQNFNKIRTHYNLFDYNQYADLDEPTMDARNSKLYCRGLSRNYDTTFVPTLSKQDCNYSEAKCLYSYAKIEDSGLYDPSGLTAYRDYPQMDIEGGGISNDSQVTVLKKCLPDSNKIDVLRNILNLDSSNIINLYFGSPVTLKDGSIWTYKGPYRTQAKDNWQIFDEAIFGSYGIFESDLDGSGNPDFGYKSLLFPREAKLEFRKDVEHFSSKNPFEEKSTKSLLTNGYSEWRDGCNLRAQKKEVADCNVTAEIEVFYKNGSDEEVSITKSKDLKLQIIPNYDGAVGTKSCNNDQGCSIGECCFNKQCWDKGLVGGTCKSDVEDNGNLGIGESCRSDYECSSLCCNQIGRCSVHSIIDGAGCQKPAGSSCLTKEFCKEYHVKTCYIIKTGIGPDGAQSCALRCYHIPTFGDCRNNICVAPSTPLVPSFDPDNPQCQNAIDPPL